MIFIGVFEIFCVTIAYILPFLPEVFEYARKIGINPEKEPHLLYLAKEGLIRELPGVWKPW